MTYNPISATPESPNYGNTEFYDMTTTPQAALLSAQNPLLKRCYTMSESHLSGYRVVIGFERLEDAQDAHEYIAKLQATQEPVQAGELPDEREAFEKWASDNGEFPRAVARSGDVYHLMATQTYWLAWQARAALSARKPLPYDLICNAIDLADTESMKGDYMLDSGDCIAVVRTMQALIEINGIGLEVKP